MAEKDSRLAPCRRPGLPLVSRPGNFDLEMFWKKIAGEGRAGGKGTEPRGFARRMVEVPHFGRYLVGVLVMVTGVVR